MKSTQSGLGKAPSAPQWELRILKRSLASGWVLALPSILSPLSTPRCLRLLASLAVSLPSLRFLVTPAADLGSSKLTVCSGLRIWLFAHSTSPDPLKASPADAPLCSTATARPPESRHS